MNEPDDWVAAWRPMIDRIGTDIGDGSVRWGVDPIEAGAIRRYLEPLEFDCALHTDPEVARANGHRDVTAPYTSITTFALPAVWSPGERQFASAERNAQPARLSVKPRLPDCAPPVTGFFVTEWEADYLRPVVAGERLGRRGQRLVACTPKRTRVGRGAFVTFESEVIAEPDEVVARLRTTSFVYEPDPGAAG